MSLRRQNPEPAAATSSRLSDVLAIGLAASVAKIKREEGVAKAVPADIADFLGELIQKLDVESIDGLKRQPDETRAGETIVLDADDSDGHSASSELEPRTRASRNMRRVASGMGWNYGKTGIADHSENARKKKSLQKNVARSLYLNYRLVSTSGDDTDSNDDLATEEGQELVKLVDSYRNKAADGSKADVEFDAMYDSLVEYTHSEVTASAKRSVASFVGAAYADTTQAAQAPEKPVLQVVSTDEEVAASYMLYLEKASAVAMRIRVEVPGDSRTWKMAGSSRLNESQALEQITDYVTERGVLPASEFKTDTVKTFFRDLVV